MEGLEILPLTWKLFVKLPGDDANLPGNEADLPGDDANLPGNYANLPGDDAELLVMVRICSRMRDSSAELCRSKQWSAITLTNSVTDWQSSTTALAVSTNSSLF